MRSRFLLASLLILLTLGAVAAIQAPRAASNVHVQATLATTSCTTTVSAVGNIQPAINNAASGDVVCVAAGTYDVRTTLTVSGKKLTLLGAGASSTTLSINAGTSNGLTIAATTTNAVRLSGFTIISAAGTTSTALVQVTGTIGDVDAFRIDNNVFDDNTFSSNNGHADFRLLTVQSVYGVVDDNVFWRRAGGQPIDVYGSPDGSDIGYTPWTKALNKGSKEAVYVEDNVFHKSVQFETIDAYGGARTVFRFNTFDGECVGRHGFDSGNRRSALANEMYGNAYTWTGAGNPCGNKANQVRGGTEIWFGNTFDNSYNGINGEVYYARATNSFSVDSGMAGWLYCDGTKYDLDSQLTHSTTYGTVNRFRNIDNETTCSGPPTGTCVAPVDTGANTGSVAPYGYPCRDQPGRAPGQVLAPLYQWNNGSHNYVASYNGCGGQGVTDGSCSPLVAGGLPVSTWIASDRDYYNGKSTAQTSADNCGTGCSPFDGTTGVGWGRLLQRPTTCTTGVAYFATDQGSWNTSSSNPDGVQQTGADGVLYKCTSTNTWTTYYTPYTYPHPLRSVL